MRKLTGAISRSEFRDLHQPDSREDRRDVRLAGDHPRWPSLNSGNRWIDVRRIGQLRRRRRVGQPRQGQGRQEQGAPVPRRRIRMMHADGISYEGDVLDLAMAHKIVTKTGAWFRHGDEQLGQGRERVRALLKENPKLTEDLRQKVLAAMGLAE